MFIISRHSPNSRSIRRAAGNSVREPRPQRQVLPVSDAAGQGGVSAGQAGAGGADPRRDQVADCRLTAETPK